MNQEVIEIWKDIYYIDIITGETINYIGCYKISNLGRVKSLEREIFQNGNKKIIKEKILKKHKINGGYFQVSLSKNGKERRFLTHRLVAYMFIPNPDNKPEVDHIIPISNGGTDNVLNLRWVNKLENMNNKETIKNMINNNAHLSGEKHPMYKKYGKENPSSKKVNQFDLDGNFIKTWDSVVDVARYYNVSDSSICSCCNGRIKSVCGFIWSYKNKVKKYNNKNEKAIIQLDLEDNIIKIFKRIQDAVDELGLKEGSRIGLCCKGKAKTAYGFKWKYLNEDSDKNE